MNFRIPLFALLLFPSILFGAVIFEGAATTAVNSTNASTIDSASHTVTADTTILLLVTGMRANARSVSTVEDWAVGEPFVFIADSNPSDNADPNFEIWGVIDPEAKTNTITVTFDSATDNDYQYATLINYGGTVITNIAAATNILQEVDNSTAGTTTVFSSAGTSGNGLVVAGGARGIGATATINASFTELIESDTGGGDTGNGDSSFYHAYLLNAAPAAPTITWSASRDNAGIYLELVVASTSVAIKRRRHTL